MVLPFLFLIHCSTSAAFISGVVFLPLPFLSPCSALAGHVPLTTSNLTGGAILVTWLAWRLLEGKSLSSVNSGLFSQAGHEKKARFPLKGVLGVPFTLRTPFKGNRVRSFGMTQTAVNFQVTMCLQKLRIRIGICHRIRMMLWFGALLFQNEIMFLLG